MLKSLGRYSDLAPFVLRVGIGLFQFFSHGIPHLTGGPDRWEGLGRATEAIGIGFAPVFWGLLASVIQTVGGLLLVLGLFVRPASVALMTVVLMATARNLATAGTLVGARAHPTEVAVALLALALLGAGKYSLDRRFGLDR